MTTKRKTTDIFKEEVKMKTGNEYTVIGEYINNKTKIEMRHEKCGKGYLVRPHDFLNKNRRCPHCFKSIKPTTDEFKQTIKNLSSKEYEVFGDYINNHTKLEFKHIECGNTFMMRPMEFLRGQRCPICYGSKRKTTEEFKTELAIATNNEFELISEYVNNKTKITVKHIKCGTVYGTLPNSLLRVKNCRKCSGLALKTHETFLENVSEKYGDSYAVLSNYINNKTPVTLKHNICKHIFLKRPDLFLNGQTCPYCSGASYGETIIRDFLEEKSINYEREFSFNDLVGKKNNLRFDFKITLRDTIFLLEFDGEQHYNPNTGIGNFEETYENDHKKNEYCILNEINLMRIPFTEIKNIRNILEKFISSTTIPDEFKVVEPSGSKSSAALYKLYGVEDIV